MRMILFDIPLIVLVIGLLFGQIRVLRTAVFFVCWLVGAEILMFVGLANITNPVSILWFAFAVFAAALAIPVAVLFGLATSKPVSPAPVVVAAQAAHNAYDGLDEDDKRALRAASRMGVKLSLAGFADFLRFKKFYAAARTARSVANSL